MSPWSGPAKRHQLPAQRRPGQRKRQRLGNHLRQHPHQRHQQPHRQERHQHQPGRGPTGGNSVKMDVGGGPPSSPCKTKSTSASEQHSSGLNLSLCIPPVLRQRGYGQHQQKATPASTTTTKAPPGKSGIVAGNKDGSGGYTITVRQYRTWWAAPSPAARPTQHRVTPITCLPG